MNRVLLSLHLLGLALGLSVPFSNIVMQSLIAKAAPAEQPILGRFPPAMIRVGDIGLVLLWITGPILLFTKHNGFAGLSPAFHVKLTAVVVLTLGVGFIHGNMKKAATGDAAAISRVQTTAKVTLLAALTALVGAVITFN